MALFIHQKKKWHEVKNYPEKNGWSLTSHFSFTIQRSTGYNAP
jgi:hypothetical protein